MTSNAYLPGIGAKAEELIGDLNLPDALRLGERLRERLGGQPQQQPQRDVNHSSNETRLLWQFSHASGLRHQKVGLGPDHGSLAGTDCCGGGALSVPQASHPVINRVGERGISRFSSMEVPYMPWFCDPAGPTGDSP